MSALTSKISPTTASTKSPLAILGGVWVGNGHGIYPTIKGFDYNERVSFVWSPKGFFAYQQSTNHPQTGAALHAESGFLRVAEKSTVIELVIAQPSGVVEVHAGNYVVREDGSVLLELEPVSVATTPTAKSVVSVRRTFTLQGTTLKYDLGMEAEGLPMQHHLSATLHRQK